MQAVAVRSDRKGIQLPREIERWQLWSLQATAKAQAQPNPTQPVRGSFRATQRMQCSFGSGLAQKMLR